MYGYVYGFQGPQALCVCVATAVGVYCPETKKHPSVFGTCIVCTLCILHVVVSDMIVPRYLFFPNMVDLLKRLCQQDAHQNYV